jgi:hypothetical protein
MRALHPGNTEWRSLALEIEQDPDLEHFIFESISDDPHCLDSLEEVRSRVEFFHQHPSWWSQNIEAFFENLESQVKQHLPPGSQLDWEITSGATAGVYGFAKGTVTGAWDLLRYAVSLGTESAVRADALSKMRKMASVSMRLQFGTAQMKHEALREIGDFVGGIYDGVKEQMQQEWQQATDSDTRARLISKWAARGVLEVATVAFAALKGSKVIALSRATETLYLGHDALEFGLQLNKAIKKYGLDGIVEAGYTNIRMQRYEQYRERFAKLRGVSGKVEGVRGVPAGSSFPFYDAHPESLTRHRMRWHLPDQKAVYFGTSESVTQSEVARWNPRGREFDFHKVRLRYRNALDLTDPANLRRLGITQEVLYGSDVSHSQVISALARKNGFDAIIAKSAAASSDSPNLILLRKEITWP